MGTLDCALDPTQGQHSTRTWPESEVSGTTHGHRHPQSLAQINNRTGQGGILSTEKDSSPSPPGFPKPLHNSVQGDRKETLTSKYPNCLHCQP